VYDKKSTIIRRSFSGQHDSFDFSQRVHHSFNESTEMTNPVSMFKIPTNRLRNITTKEGQIDYMLEYMVNNIKDHVRNINDMEA
jgi:hypothetical protein